MVLLISGNGVMRASVTCVLAGRSSTTRKADDGTMDVSADAISSRMVGRSRLPSLPTCAPDALD